MGLRAVFLGCLLLLPARPQDLQEFEKSVTEFTLANGLHFIVVERHEAPVVSFHTYVDAGAVDDPKGATGLAHMFEHMAFKGTEKIGTKNWLAERQALAAVDAAFEALAAERNQGLRADPEKLKPLEAAFKAAREKAAALGNPEEFSRIIEENGGVGLNASTSSDSTNYFYSLPANRVELWFYLESERFLRPVFRGFYEERDVVREERRMRSESSPVGKLVEALTAATFIAHPYGQPPVGWGSDVENFGLPDAEAFFRKYYIASQMTIGIAGDVDPRQIRRLAETYFGRLPKRPPPPPVRTVEPRQEGERRVHIESQAQPLVVVAYKKPSQHDPDRAVFDAISSVLSGGRTGWFYKEMVRDKQIALDAGGFPNFPGAKYPDLFVFYAFPNSGHTVATNEEAILKLVDRIRNEKVDEDTLRMVKTKMRAGLIQKLDDNSGLAAEVAANHAFYGDWRQMFRDLDEINKVTADDVQRVARKYFTRETRTVASLVQPPKEEKPAAGGPQ